MKPQNYIFTKLALALFVLISFGLTSCKPDNTHKSKIIAESIEAAPEGGVCEISYSIENPTEGSTIIANTDASWISTNFEYLDGKIKFMVTPNEGADRSAEITLKYDGAEDLRVTVSQKVFSIDGDFAISLQAVNPYGATIRFTANGHQMNYFFLVMGKEAIDEYYAQGGEEALYQADFEWIEYLAANNGMTVEEFLPLAVQIYAQNGEETTMDYTTLEPNESYYAYCYGMDTKGNKLTSITRKEFVTEVVDPIDIEFEMEATNIQTTSATITVTPSKDSEYYWWTYVKEGDYLKYGDIEIVKIMTENLKADAASAGLDITDLMKLGESSATPTDLWADAKYYIVAWAMDEKGNLISEITSNQLFTTKAETVFDDCTFEISFPEVKDMDIQINVKPSKNTTRYYIACISDDRTLGYTPDQMAKRVIDMEADRLDHGDYGDGVTWENAPFLFTGEQTKWAQEDLYWTFKPDYTYHTYVFGIDENGNRTTEVAHKTQKTLPAEASDMTFTVTMSDPTWKTGVFKVVPSNDDEYYMTHLIESSYLETFRKEDGTLDEQELMHEIEHYYDNSILYYLKQGTTEQVYSWASDMEFTFLTFAYAGTNTTQMFEYKVKTPPIPFTSDADVATTLEIFDGDELYEMDPIEWERAQGSPVVRMTFKPNEKAVKWYGSIWAPISNYERGVDHLMHLIMNPTVSFINEDSGVQLPSWNGTFSFPSVAEGADGTFGPWHYEEFTPTKGETTKAYDFWSDPSSTSVVRIINEQMLNQAKEQVYSGVNKVKTTSTPVSFVSKASSQIKREL